MDLGTISAALTSLNAAGKIAQGLMSLKTMADVQSVAIDLNQKIIAAQTDIFAAQTAQAATIQRVRDLEEQITKMRNWEEQKERYKLTEPWGNGGFVYGVKESRKESEPAHWICTKCYDDGRRSILQPRPDKGLWLHMTCPTCNSSLQTGWRGIASPAFVPD